MVNYLSRQTMETVREAVKIWLNTCPDLPAPVTFESLPENNAGLCFSTTQSPAYLKRYIAGGYKAQYQFQLIYRVLPSDDEDALDAVAELTQIASWCEEAVPPTLEGAVNIRVERTSDAAILASYEDGSEDYGTSMTLTWEVI